MKNTDLSTELGFPAQWSDPQIYPDSMVLLTVSHQDEEKSILVTSMGNQIVDAKDYVVVETPKVKKKAKPITKILRGTTLVFGWLLASMFIGFALLSITGVATARVVLTNSMAPSINPGDVLITLAPDRLSPELGKVVVYIGKRFDGSAVGVTYAHRIIGGDLAKGFEVKGDNNDKSDVQRPKLAEIVGVGLFVIPFVGRILTPQFLALLLILGFAIWLIYDAWRESD